MGCRDPAVAYNHNMTSQTTHHMDRMTPTTFNTADFNTHG